MSRREHSQREIADKLAQRGFDVDVVSEALAWLVRQDLLSDERFADGYVRGRIRKGYGPLRIRHELRERGIDPGLAEKALTLSGVDWDIQLRSVCEKKFGRVASADVRERARRARFLQYRGFAVEKIRQVLE